MQTLIKLTVAANTTAEIVELGFVPSKIRITNRTSLATLEWNENLPAGYWYKTVAAGTRTLVTSAGPTVLDGSDKTNNLETSFGFNLPTQADINDTLGEILDIEASRDDI